MTTAPIWTCTPGGSCATPAWKLEGGLPTVSVWADPTTGTGQIWPAVQPGVFDASGGRRGHRITVEFDIVEQGATLLTLEFSSERGPCPNLEITLDDTHRGVFYPTVDRAGRTPTGRPGPVAGAGRLQVGFPAEWLPAGRHILAFTTAFDPAASMGEHHPGVTHGICYRPPEPPAGEHDGRWFGSHLRWSKAELAYTAVFETAVDVQVRPTALFIRRGETEVELLEVDVIWTAGTPPPTTIALGWPTSRTMIPPAPAGRDFGMFRVRIPAPELEKSPTVAIYNGSRMRLQQLTPCRR